jgi:hypothetical protein
MNNPLFGHVDGRHPDQCAERGAQFGYDGASAGSGDPSDGALAGAYGGLVAE